ncbi:MAG: D-glycero-beta-D-manno-heptose 1-phosphate adenylyltransferase [Chitinophagaceae bacterium]|nr:D-glycero-beta-D-manno-heptose 1-phosphate adenylyltransferase [Chitinophagaceae bacterium]
MKRTEPIVEKIIPLQQLPHQLNRWQLLGKKVVFTNGVFDILHSGHIKLLSEAAAFSDILIVGINSDASVKRLKGNERPVNNQESRALLLACLIMVDAVVIFEEDTPLELIKMIMPDVLVKGGDYTLETIVGSKEVMANKGQVKMIPLLDGFSSTNIIDRIKNIE